MNWVENLLIIAGISLDVFAAMEIQGAMIANLKQKTILVACGVVAGLELIFYLGAYAFCRLISIKGLIANPVSNGEIIAVVISNIYTAAAGCACGLVGTTVWQIIAIILVMSVIMVSAGLYTGLHFGFEKKTIAYLAGALLLWGVGAEIFLNKVINLI